MNLKLSIDGLAFHFREPIIEIMTRNEAKTGEKKVWSISDRPKDRIANIARPHEFAAADERL